MIAMNLEFTERPRTDYFEVGMEFDDPGKRLVFLLPRRLLGGGHLMHTVDFTLRPLTCVNAAAAHVDLPVSRARTRLATASLAGVATPWRWPMRTTAPFK